MISATISSVKGEGTNLLIDNREEGLDKQIVERQ